MLPKNVRSLNSCERFEELTQEVEGCRWCALLISETWRSNNAEILETQQKLTKSKQKSIQIVGGDFNADLEPGFGVERVSVGPHTLFEGNMRGDWMKQWLMIQNFAASTRCTEKRRKTSYIQDTERWRGNTCVAAEMLKQMT